MTGNITTDLVIFCFVFAVSGFLYFGWESRRLDRKYPPVGSEIDKGVSKD
jgi:hypothetical protein